MFVRVTAAAALLAGAFVAMPAQSQAWCGSPCQVQNPCAPVAGTYSSQYDYTTWQSAPAASHQGHYTADWNAAAAPVAPDYYGHSYANHGYHTAAPHAWSGHDSVHAAPRARARVDAARTRTVSAYDSRADWAPQNLQYSSNYSAQNYGFDGASGSTSFQYGNDFNTSANWNYQGNNASSGSFQGSAGVGAFNGGLAF